MEHDSTSSIGVRDLRADLATTLRRAAAGHRIVVRVAGRPTAIIGPLGAGATEVAAESLVAGGLVVPPRRRDGPRPVAPVPVWSGVRLDRALRDVRG
jgi:prevent-host-death family protein